MKSPTYSSPKRSPLRGYDDTQEIDLFCRIEKAVDSDSGGFNEEYHRGSLAAEFPTSFIDNNPSTNYSNEISGIQMQEYRELYKELMTKLEIVKQKKTELERDLSWVKKEKKQLARERASFEEERLLKESSLEAEEIRSLHEKYNQLKQKYHEDKKQWDEEKQQLLFKLDEYESREIGMPTDEQLNSGKISLPIHKPTPPKKSTPKKNTSKTSILPEPGPFETHKLNFDIKLGLVIREEARSDGRKVLRYKDGTSATVFRNGTLKTKRDGIVYVFYKNGDIALEFIDGARGYKYCETGTIELTLSDSTVFLQFTNGQREEHKPNGDKAISYPNGQYKIIHPNGDYEVRHPSGKLEQCINGKLLIQFEEMKA